MKEGKLHDDEKRSATGRVGPRQMPRFDAYMMACIKYMTSYGLGQKKIMIGLSRDMIITKVEGNPVYQLGL